MLRSALVRRSVSARVLLLPGFSFAPARSASGRVLSGFFVPFPSPFVLAAVRPVVGLPPVPAASIAGSRLFLSSPAFVSALSAGCPVRFLLSVFRWPVRSAVVLCLCRVFLSRSSALLLVPRSVRVSFLRACLSSLGYSVSGRAPVSVTSSWLSRRALSPSAVPSFCGVASVGGLSAGLSALSRCLRWLGCRGSSCPPAVAPALALLAFLVASSLA